VSKVTIDELGRMLPGQRGTLIAGGFRTSVVVTTVTGFGYPDPIALEIDVTTNGEPARITPPTSLDDRRQGAREAFDDAMSTPSESHDGPLLIRARMRQDRAREAAIGVATRVTITPEVLAAFRDTIDTTTAKLRAAFEAAGFEVEQ
jgi:hypothetical protein